MTPLRSKALSVLRECRVRVVHADKSPDGVQPAEVIVAIVDSSREHRPHYVIDLRFGDWSCTGQYCVQPCPHVAATQMVTGHPSPAAKELQA